MTLKQVKAVRTLEDLQSLGIGEVDYDISYRGGGLGFAGSDVAQAVGVKEDYLPNKFGCGCNYLGGGLRGSIFPSDFNRSIKGQKQTLLAETRKCLCPSL